ncbi:MAG: hypothetical protein LBJ67_19205 [Planctomycetaceae bacterium]|nr:hypothetical protein [Planctomycetaceae bacterium]
MKKFCVLFAIAVAVVGFSTGCNGFKGFCDKGSLFPTRQPQVMPMQSSYVVTTDACSSQVVTNPCDPCCGGMESIGPFSEPITL